MKQGYLDGVDLRFIEDLARELRRSGETAAEFEARCIEILRLYLEGIQTRSEILKNISG
jgi:hypothetical protein